MQTITNITVSTAVPLVREKAALDSVKEQLQAGRIAGALDELFEDLRGRREEEPQDWPAYARACLSHPVSSLLHQDPFTYRAFAKPRGYAGDAVMMDYIYGLGEAGEAARNATPLGRAIFQYMDTRPSAKAVRYRRRLIAGLIDRVAERKEARVLAVAAGHLREVKSSSAMQNGKVQEFVAFDQDEASLAVVARDYAHLGIRTMAGSVRQILSGKAKLGKYDFVYAAGLFDYLSGPVAAALTCRMFEMTRPGGLMLIPNFLTGVRDSGYMEAFMEQGTIVLSAPAPAGGTVVALVSSQSAASVPAKHTLPRLLCGGAEARVEALRRTLDRASHGCAGQ
jgi:extracellular factor (EF) 3-hydroxypalmitic acid methyl ester biosynthesis protein